MASAQETAADLSRRTSQTEGPSQDGNNGKDYSIQYGWYAPRRACTHDSLTHAVLRSSTGPAAAANQAAPADAGKPPVNPRQPPPASTNQCRQVPILELRRPSWHYTLFSCLQTLVTLHCFSAVIVTYKWYTVMLVPVAIQIAFSLEDYSKSLDGTRGGTPFNTSAVLRGGMWLHRGIEGWLGVSCLESRDDVVADCAVSGLAWFFIMFCSYRLGKGMVNHLTNLELFTFVSTCDIVAGIHEIWMGKGVPVLLSTVLAMWLEFLSRLGFIAIPGIVFTHG